MFLDAVSTVPKYIDTYNNAPIDPFWDQKITKNPNIQGTFRKTQQLGGRTVYYFGFPDLSCLKSEK